MATFIRCDVEECKTMIAHEPSLIGVPVPRGWAMLTVWIPDVSDMATAAAMTGLADAVSEINPNVAAVAQQFLGAAMGSLPRQPRLSQKSVVMCPNHELPKFRASTASNGRDEFDDAIVEEVQPYAP
jgi:hypothetical protein